VQFKTPLVTFIVVPAGATTGERIFLGSLDGVNPEFLMYDNSNRLIASIAAAAGSDSTGQGWNVGFMSFNPTDRKNYAQLTNGALVLNVDNPPEVIGAIMQALAGQGPSNNQPSVLLTSPSNDGRSSSVELFGDDANPPTEAPYVRFGMNGAAVDMDVLVGGQLKYSLPSSLSSGPETWHSILSLAPANWAAVGAPWSDPKFQRTAVGTVRLAGAIEWTDGVTAAPVTMFTLPSGYIPNFRKRLPLITMTGDAVTPQVEGITVQSLTDPSPGAVQLTNYPAGGPNTPISLDGLEFDLLV